MRLPQIALGFNETKFLLLWNLSNSTPIFAVFLNAIQLSSMQTNFVDRFHEIKDLGEVVLLLPRVRPKNYGFRGKMWGGHDAAIFTMLYLILLTLWFHKFFKSIFPKSSSWPKTMYVEHWRKLAWTTFLGNFPILLVQQFCGSFVKVAYLNMLLYLQSKISFNWLFWLIILI